MKSISLTFFMKKQVFKLLLAAICFSLLTISCQPETTAEEENIVGSAEKTIVELVAGTASMSTLAKAITAAGIDRNLSGPGPFTIFAPSDEAFDALPDGMLESLLKPENLGQLNNLLIYHVVPGARASSSFQNGLSLGTVQGEKIVVSVSDGVKINGAAVTAADVQVSNGVIHVINEVLIPSSIK